MNLKLLSIALVSLIVFINANALIVTEWPTVDTKMNKVGIEADEVCKFDAENDEIFCSSNPDEGIKVKAITGSSTGTPPWLQFGNDYVGQTLGVDAQGKPGAGKRTIYLKD